MDTQKFLNLSILDKVEVVNKMLEEETENHLKNCATKLGLSPSTFSKVMRDNSSYQYNQTGKRYDRLLTLDEYKQYLQSGSNTDKTQESLLFISKHIDELKQLLQAHSNQLILNPKVYDPNNKTITKTVQVNADIYEEFTNLWTTHYPHLRLRDIVSQSLLDFTTTYHKDKAPSV
ncbi:hypothetical protein [Evansella tamaricis]|uniref:Uncharacterized protein n=1 Tax=Evansella tamaricis TaxID=2069301 RepID=A0ABS6JCH4_9BACI|nr:hypothetical protein [Evansella tamaricis]MBU9710889.1 hypothetical protein [Evansella tamaricis]